MFWYHVGTLFLRMSCTACLWTGTLNSIQMHDTCVVFCVYFSHVPISRFAKNLFVWHQKMNFAFKQEQNKTITRTEAININDNITFAGQIQ